MYVPDQSSDVVSEYFTEDVDLIPMPFPGRSNKRVYSLNVVATATDASDDTVANGLVPVQQSYQWTASPGDEIPIEITLEAATDFIANSSATTTTPDSTDTPLVQHITGISYTNNGSQLRVAGTLIMPEDSEFETLYITGKLTAFVPEMTPTISANTITINRPVDSTIATALQTVIPVSGIPGDVKRITYQIEAVTGRIMENVDESHSNASLSIGVVTGDEEKVATITFDYTVPTTPENVIVTVTADTLPAPGLGITIITKTLTITNNVANTTVEDGLSIEFKGVAGDVSQRNITVNPSNDKYISALTASGTGPIVVGTPYESGEDWEVPIDITIEENSTQPTLTIGGTINDEPYSITFNVNNLGLNNAQIAMDSVQHRVTFDDADFGVSFPRAGEELLVTIEPIGNYAFTSIDDIQIDINEAAATVTVDGMTNQRVLPEIQFSPGTVTLQPNGSLVFPITGTFPTLAQGGGQYVLDVNIIGSNTSNGGSGGGPTEGAATNANTTLTKLTPGISAAGGTAQFRLVTDGVWNISFVEIRLDGSGTSVSTDGTFSEMYSNTSSPPLTFTQSGSIGPLTGGAGEHIITLNVEPIGYASRVSGSSDEAFTVNGWFIEYFFSVRGIGDIAAGEVRAIKSSVVTESGDFGTANIVLPGFTSGNLMALSTATGADNLVFFG